MAVYLAQFDKCPACGSAETLAKKAKEEELAKGHLKPETPVFISRSITALTDGNLLIGASVPLLVTSFDVCAKCGCYYCTSVERMEGQAKPAPGEAPWLGGYPPPGRRAM